MLAAIEQLATWLVNPWLFIAGTAAVLLPILIHLLNQRRFRVVDWAAMDFLLEADKKNRRRIRVENLLLLLLRCLAVFLIGLLLARPFLPKSATAGLIDAAQYERIVILDDSLSMQARLGNETAWEIARRGLLDLTSGLAHQPGDNSLTLILTSQRAQQRMFNAAPLNPSSIDHIQAAIERLGAGDGVAQLQAVLQELGNSISAQPRNVSRIVYLYTDLRRHDWPEAADEGPVHSLTQLARLVQGCFVIDAADDESRNLTITQVRPEGTLVQDVPSAFDCVVKNQGTAPTSDVRVKFVAGEALPVETTIQSLAPGESQSVRFQFTFAGDEPAADAARGPPPRQVVVEVQSAEHGADDRLSSDSVAYFPARPARGVPVLIVDGDPSAEFGRAESFFLRRALAPAGPVPSGIAPEVVTAADFDSLPIDPFQLIFLLNDYRLGENSEDNVRRLETWVAAGGSLVIMPGDQIDAQQFNAHYWRGGEGLSPLELQQIRGDDQQRTWIGLRVTDANHELLKQFAGQASPLLENVKVFRWWGTSTNTSQQDREINVLARLGNAEESPAIAERAFGKGRVVALAIPADSDWHNWPSDPSYVLIVQDLVRYLTTDRGGRALVRVGEPIRHPIDVSQYELDATLHGPHDLKVNLKAVAPAEGESTAGQTTSWLLEYPAAAARGFYHLTLARRDGPSDTLLFAANVDPSEGDLKRVDRREFERELARENIKIIAATESPSLASESERTEVWWYLLWMLVAVLSVEQVLGWWFGRAAIVDWKWG